MSEQNAGEAAKQAATQAKAAKGQAKAAGRAAAKAARIAAENGANHVAEEAADTANKIEGSAQVLQRSTGDFVKTHGRLALAGVAIVTGVVYVVGWSKGRYAGGRDLGAAAAAAGYVPADPPVPPTA